MPLAPYPLQGFSKGLNLRDKPDAVDPAECIDAMNVLFGERGAIESRPGYEPLTDSSLTNRVQSLEAFYTSSGTKQLLAGCGTRLEALSSSGAVVDSETGAVDGIWDFARFGEPNEEVAYAGNGVNGLRKWNGSEWTAPDATVDGVAGEAMPFAGSLCVDPGSNRLFCTAFATTNGGPKGLTSSPSHGYYSDPGNPESYESSAFLQFTPGDGEKIQRAIAWGEFLFVFKETKFFVPYQRGTDAEGKPEFDYRPVEGGAGLVSPRAVCAHPSGVYFMARNGVYRTTGQDAELVSSLVEPIWSGLASPFYTGGTLAHSAITNCAMGVWEDRIYLAFPTVEANNRVLVYDPAFDWWSLYDIPASCFTSFRVGSEEELIFGYASGENLVGRHSPSVEMEGDAFWRSGWDDVGDPSEKVIRASKVWGTGTVQMGLDSDFAVNTGDLTDLDLSGDDGTLFEGEGGVFEGEGGFFEGFASVLNEAYRGVSEDGTVFSTYFAGTGRWSVHRVEHLLRQPRNPETVTD